MIFHFGTSSWGDTRELPRTFYRTSVALLSSVLKSKRAIIEIGSALLHLVNRGIAKVESKFNVSRLLCSVLTQNRYCQGSFV